MSRTTVEVAIAAAERPVLLETAGNLEVAERAWSTRSVLGIDTEFVRERTYRADLGLIQVSDGVTAWLWDPLRFDSSEPVQRLLTNGGIFKVLHAGSEDLEVLLHALDVMPEPFCDTQIACAMLGQPLQLSYQGAVKWLFDIDVEKDHTRSNWCKRPLRPGQLRYAAMDVVLLPQMLEALKARLESAGRWDWLLEEAARMRETAAEPVDPDLAYLRIGGANRMDDESLRALRALARWREETAQARNRARGFVVSDAGLLELARLRPTTPSDIQVIGNIHPRALQRYQPDLLQAIATAAGDRSKIHQPEPLDNRQRHALNEMRRVVNARAKKLDVDPALLASRRELERLLRAVTAGKPPPERFCGWRQAVITDELLSLMG
jgi:ribonuclease D